MLDIEYYPGWPWNYVWILYLGFIFCFFVAFGMGANDCANSYATVVGAGVLKLWQAYILATVFEVLGAGLLGYKVTSTMTKSVVDVSIYTVKSASVNSTYLLACDNTTDFNCTSYTQADFGIGELSALISTAAWLIFASILMLPVSTTQSTVGATVGFSLVLKGSSGIHWSTIINIAISWVTSPLLAGLTAVIFYIVVKYSVLKQDDQFDWSLKMMPFFYWFALLVNIFAVIFEGSKYLKFDTLAWYYCFAISFGISTSVALFVWFFGRHWVRKRVISLKEQSRLTAQIRAALEAKSNETMATSNGNKQLSENDVYFSTQKESISTDVEIHLTPIYLGNEIVAKSSSTQSPTDSRNQREDNHRTLPVETIKTCWKSFKSPVVEDPMATEVFHYLQIMSACFLSFSHGANDTANCVGALVGIWVLFKKEYVGGDLSDDGSLEYLTIFGALSMVLGLWCLGHKVIKTMGNSLTEVTAPSGFCMELGTAFTVLFASKLGIPISTTHCAVGAIVAVGWYKSEKDGISWKLFKNIAIAWLVTLPVCGCVAALLAYLLSFAVK